MFDHVVLGVRDLARSKHFYLTALESFGVTAVDVGDPVYGIEICGSNDASLGLSQTDAPTSPLHLAFVARTRAQVEAFHRAALGAGGADNGAPGLRPKYHPHYYAAFVRDPDGHNVEAVCHHPEG